MHNIINSIISVYAEEVCAEWKFRADSESEVRIHLKFDMTILDFF